MNRKRKPCKYCCRDQNTFGDRDRTLAVTLDVERERISAKLWDKSYSIFYIPLNYCPNCGRRVSDIKYERSIESR